MLGQQVVFRRELATLMELARRNGVADDPLIRDRLARAWIGLETIRCNAPRMLAGVAAGAPAPRRPSGRSTGRPGTANWANSPWTSAARAA
nr:hypothetical protein [Streptomyces noursei]